MNNAVELLGWYGGDVTHACSGWVSTERELTDEKRARIGQFLKDLAENDHHTPFEKSMIHFLVTCDTASHIHMLKHRIGVSINAESARYKELKEGRYYIPRDWPGEEQAIFKEHTEAAWNRYRFMLNRLEERGFPRKRAKESARFLLPYSTQVTVDISFNFRSFMHFQGLRNKPDAQREIRRIAENMLEQVKLTTAFNHSLAGFGYLD